MSWEKNLLDASFRGVPIDVADENLEAQRYTSQHGTPYKDGDSVEDLGRGARAFAMRVIFNGPNYDLWLQLLLKALDIPGQGELIHPIYGRVSVVTQSWRVRHTAERPDYAEVDLQFLEDIPDNPFFGRDLALTLQKKGYAEDEVTWQDGLFDLLAKIDSLVAEIQSWIGGGWTGLLEKALGLPGIGLRLQQLRSQIMGVVSQVKSMASSDPSSAFDPLVDLTRTPTEIRGAIQNSTPSTSRELLSRSGIPATVPGSTSLTAQASRAATALLVSARQGTEPDASVIPDSMPTDPVEAAGLALVVLIITETALANAQAVSVIIEDEATTQTLSPSDVEALVNLVRSLLESAILLHRRLYDVQAALPVIDALRTMAGLIQARARTVILLSPPLVERPVESAANLRLLAHRWYGDHSRAIELARLNPGLSAPYNIQPGEVLRAYAK